MIDEKTAFFAAQSYLKSMDEFIIRRNCLFDLRFEEFELSVDGNSWLITLSFISGIHLSSSERRFKVFKVNSETGDVEAMIIRAVDADGNQ